MTDLHAELTALSVDWPATPDLADGVLARLARRPRRAGDAAALAPRARLRGSRRCSPRSRSRWPPRPTRAPRCSSGSGSRASRSSGASRPRRRPRRARSAPASGSARRSRWREARERSPFLAVPDGAGLGEPDAVYVGGDDVSLVYGSRPGYARAERPAPRCSCRSSRRASEPFIEKTVGIGGAARAPARRRRAGVLHRRRARVRVRAATAARASSSSGSPGTRCWWSGPTGCCSGSRGISRATRAVAIAQSVP